MLAASVALIGVLVRPHTPSLSADVSGNLALAARALPYQNGALDRVSIAMSVFTSGEMIRAHATSFWKDPDWQKNVTEEQGAAVCDPRFTGTIGAY